RQVRQCPPLQDVRGGVRGGDQDREMGAAAAVGAIAAARRHSLSRPMRSYVPGSEKYIFTSSRDGADALGCEDHANGAADTHDDLQRAAKRVLTSYWRHPAAGWEQ